MNKLALTLISVAFAGSAFAATTPAKPVEAAAPVTSAAEKPIDAMHKAEKKHVAMKVDKKKAAHKVEKKAEETKTEGEAK